MKRLLPFIIILVVLGVAVGSAVYMTRSKPATPTPVATPGPQPAASSAPTPAPVRTGVPGAEPAHSLGPANAPVKIEEFGDFECPPCGMFHPILKQMKDEFGDRIQVIFREFPLSPPHQHAVHAAAAAEAAGMQNKFWEMHGMIFDHQKEWKVAFDSRPIFEGYAKQLGLDVERYKRDVTSDRVEQRIFLDGKRGHSLGVNSTPTVFLNGREVPFEHLPAERLRVLIANELRTAAAQK
ncbi:MAG TPA: thioredoxin domain-containing protein [Pyrinomonadaceae bacterium]|nr:thioredoxin domain-containing protein [Pyrinomonadaceae bacterium]